MYGYYPYIKPLNINQFSFISDSLLVPYFYNLTNLKFQVLANQITQSCLQKNKNIIYRQTIRLMFDTEVMSRQWQNSGRNSV